MTTIARTFALAAALATIAGTSLLTSTTADAGGKKELFIETYDTKKSLHGYSGHAGNHYCDYQRLPIRVCKDGHSNCSIVGWRLQQICQ